MAAPSPASSRRPLALLVLMGRFQPQFSELLLQSVPTPPPTPCEPSFQPPTLGFGGLPPLVGP